MARNRASAKAAGTTFERTTANYLAQHVDDRIDRRAKTGAKDKGDIGGLRHAGQRVAIECKNVTRTNLAGWTGEAEAARHNDQALAGIVIHKRHGNGQPGDQWVTLTLDNFIAILTGNRNHLEQED